LALARLLRASFFLTRAREEAARGFFAAATSTFNSVARSARLTTRTQIRRIGVSSSDLILFLRLGAARAGLYHHRWNRQRSFAVHSSGNGFRGLMKTLEAR
jgi:hypothetical protein